ncbi:MULTISPECIES: protein kinase [unclassified Streptomyces]|uniref:protein kinase n=1 Tax=unclassified Streptomyces TaxID=2593676 RepID=UPI0036BE7573
MDEYAGRVLADRYRLPSPARAAGGEDTGTDSSEPAETRAFDTYSGQEVLIRQVPLPEFVDAEVLDGAPGPDTATPYGRPGRATRRPAEPVVRRAIEAAQAAAQIPDHPLLDQVFDVFAEAGSLWIVSELVGATPLAALLAERPLSPYRAAEIGADVLTALRALHAHGWVHRNITPRTVLVCEDGRVVLTGLAVGAAEEALCGYAPVPEPDHGSGPDDFAAPPSYRPAPAHADEEPHEAEIYEVPEGDEDQEDAGGDDGYAYAGDHAEYDDYDDHVEYEDHTPYEDHADGQARDGYEGDGGYEGDDRARGYGGERASDAYGLPPGGSPDESGSSGTHPGARDHAGYGDPGVHGGPASGEHPGSDDEGPYAGTDEPGAGEETGHGPALYGSAPYGTDPYGRGTPPRPEPRPAPPSAQAAPTADARAARAGAIAAYRAGARAAARLGGTGALPVQRPAPVEPPAAPESPALPAPPGPPVPPPGGPAPQWWARTAADDAEDDEDEDGTDEGRGPQAGPPRLLLKGNWSDGPHAARDGSGPIPAGGGGPAGPGRAPVPPASGRPALPSLPSGFTPAAPDPAAGREDVTAPVPAGAPDPELYRGPTTRLAAERARQTRIAVVGAVTERWAPEQAGPVYDNWRLAPPIGPATDLWALGALLYRAVQGHAPYPEDNAAELVQMVCSEPPAFAEESGPLRPIVESLLRQDPTERPDVEELRGWLRSLVRSAPEPEAGVGVVPLPSFDETRLPIVRRRGELVRRRWRGRAGAGAGRARHKRGPDRAPGAHGERPTDRGPAPRPAAREYVEVPAHELFAEELPQRAPRGAGAAPRADRGRSPRALGLTLLLLVLLLLAGAVAYAVLALPGKGEAPAGSASPTGSPTGPATSGPSSAPPPSGTAPSDPGRPTTSAAPPPAADPSAPALAAGYVLRQDPEGFRVGVPRDWRRSPVNDAGQVRYTGGDFTMIVVPGRDSVRDHGSDPLEYQNVRERELEPWRASSWSGAEQTRRVDIGRTATATGSYWWLDSTGREVFVRNLALVDGGRYYVVQVIGPYGERDKVTEIHDEAVKGFRASR